MKKRLTILLILIFMALIYVFYYVMHNEKTNVTYEENDISFYYQGDDGQYVKSTDEKWQTGDYALNIQNTYCDGVKNHDYVSWDDSNNAVILKKNKAIKCNLYFDKKKKITLLSSYPIVDSDRQLTNMIKNGDYEEGNSYWENNANVSLTTEQKSHGEHSLKFNSGSLTAYSMQVLTEKSPTFGHSYYGSLKFLSNSNFTTSDGRYEWRLGDIINANTLIFSWKSMKVTDWTLSSSIATLNSTDYVSNDWRIRNLQFNPSGVSYTDELMMIDLTSSYGTNLPTKQELDNILIYFDDTVYMKSIIGLQGEFKVTGVVDNQEIECNNDGVAEVSNGVVTITGNSPYITCYLKKV